MCACVRLLSMKTLFKCDENLLSEINQQESMMQEEMDLTEVFGPIGSVCLDFPPLSFGWLVS